MARRDEIAKRAYQLWELDGRPAGQALDYWLRAENELEPTLPVEPLEAVAVRKPRKKPTGAASGKTGAEAAGATEPEAEPAPARPRRK